MCRPLCRIGGWGAALRRRPALWLMKSTLILIAGFLGIIIATSTPAVVIGGWHSNAEFMIVVAVLSAWAIALIPYLIICRLRRQDLAAQQLIQSERLQLGEALDHMSQGLKVYDASARMITCNRRYIDMFGLSEDIVKPGAHFRDVMRHRQDKGTFNGNVEEFCAMVMRGVAEGRITKKLMDISDGRAIRIVNTPLARGGWIATMEDVTERRDLELERQRADEKITHLAHYDALTDMPNRVLFREQIESEFTKIDRGEKFALLYIDIDEFKGINDSLGHHVGDELLKAVARRIRNCLRKGGLIARLGGDEFAVIQTGVEDSAEVRAFVVRLQKAIRRPYHCLGHQLWIDSSIGIALAPQDGANLDQLLKNADLAMYSAKSMGRRNYCFFASAMDANAKARLALEQDLRRALVDGGFELYYQPFVDLRTNDISGFEALLRWHHPERGVISNEEFIPVAEDTGLIVQLGDWVLRTACMDAVKWPSRIQLAVNLSPVQLRCETLALKATGILATSGLDPRRLLLEITEAVLIRDDEAALLTLHQLRSLGVRIALDDFGTGYSSLSYLKRFPFDKIKIDRSFVADVVEARSARAIVQAVVNIASASDITTVAEGVETEMQRETLRSLGCTEMQGFLCSPPMSAVEVMQLFNDDILPTRNSAS